MKGRKNSSLKKTGKNMPRLSEFHVDESKVRHHSLYFKIPSVYRDKKFNCRICDKEGIWTARQQKWWYEEAGGNLETTAVHCRECRDKKNRVKREQKEHMEEMAKIKPHPNEAFFKGK